MTEKIELLQRALSKKERLLIWDALHTFYNDQCAKGILLQSEAELIAFLIPLFHAAAFADNMDQNKRAFDSLKVFQDFLKKHKIKK